MSKILDCLNLEPIRVWPFCSFSFWIQNREPIDVPSVKALVRTLCWPGLRARPHCAISFSFRSFSLFVCLRSSLQHAGSLVEACGVQLPDLGWKRGPCVGSMESWPQSSRDVPAHTFLCHLSAHVGGTVVSPVLLMREQSPGPVLTPVRAGGPALPPGELLCLPRQHHVVSLGVQGLCHLAH